MPLTLVVEDGMGKSNATTFQSTADVTARLAAVPFTTAWTDAALIADKQDQCNLEATAILCRLAWDGVPTYQAQALAWPRAWMATPDGYAIASNLMPAFLLDAHARLCAWLAAQDATPYSDTGLQPGTEIELGSGLRFTPQAGAAALPPDIRALLAPYTRGRHTLVRG